MRKRLFAGADAARLVLPLVPGVPSVSRPFVRLLALLASVAVCAGPALAAAAPAPSHGAAGIGDGYFPADGNGGYDVTHYGIHDTYRIGSGRLTGRTRVAAVATQALDRLDLDLVLTPTAVRVDGRRVPFTKPTRHELRVDLPHPVPAGAAFTVDVSYRGRPATLGYGGEHPWQANLREAMAMNEPHIAPWWFAANDHPRDKASFDVTVRVPRGNRVIGNGDLVAKRVGATWSAWHWRVRQPISTYLAFFAAGRFTVRTGTSADGLPYTLAVSKTMPPAWQRGSMRALRRTPGIVAWEARQFGRYPFSSTGGVVTGLYPGFALENASRPTYPYWGSGRGATRVEVHELAHQWFGDAVSVDRWRDIWLNEGFATWVEWRYAETHWDVPARTQLHRSYGSHPADDPFWQVRVANPGPRHLFDQAVYDRGAMALQALRQRIGDAGFSVLLRTWVEQHRGGNARVEDFERLAEQVSGQDLGGFFTAWLHSRTRPEATADNGLT